MQYNGFTSHSDGSMTVPGIAVNQSGAYKLEFYSSAQKKQPQTLKNVQHVYNERHPTHLSDKMPGK